MINCIPKIPVDTVIFRQELTMEINYAAGGVA